MTEEAPPTPAAAGFAMPPEWEPHAACLMAWPTREELWRGHLGEAKADYAAVASAVSAFEPVVMVCNPGSAREVRNSCGRAVEPLELPIDDSWTRDNGPIFVRSEQGTVAAVKFGFNAWGERFHPYANDASLPERIADHLGVQLFRATQVLEGGSFFVDGEGTLITTEQCLLNPNRNPGLTRTEIEQGLKDFLGVTKIIWLPFGHSLDVGPQGTDGHVDGVAQMVAPGHVVLEAPSHPDASEFEHARENLKRLEGTTDASGRVFEISRLDPDPGATMAYANYYLANGAVVVPVNGHAAEAQVLEFIGGLHPGREVVGVPGEMLAFGGGGPHCITQQIPVGV